ncbi:MAG: GMP/IMP nucleotidase [Aeromonadaceae bacterium]
MLAWQEIETVLLDMDGTLIDLHFDNFFWQQRVPERWGQARGLTLEEAQRQLQPKFAAVAGTLEWYCLEYWSKTLQLDIVAMKQEIEHKVRWRPDVRPFLEALRLSGRRLFLFTNAHPASLALKLKHTALDRYLDGLYSTHEFGLSKEHQGCWQALRQRLDFTPERTLFIDDSPRILGAARQFGIGHLLGILNPDSEQPHQQVVGFPAISDYGDLLPGLLAAGPQR